MNKVQQLLNEVSQIIKIHEEHANKQGENFNIFSILRMEKREVKTHSNFIYELLNPQGLHGQGKMFLESFAKIVLNSEVSNTAIDPQQEYSTEENRRIDFTLRTAENIIGIEMKIDAGDQENQLFDYYKELEKIANKEKGVKLFYLTLDGKEASEQSLKSKDGKEILKEKKEDENKAGYERISFETHILNWINDCIQKSAEKSVLREALIQYKILIEKITGQNMDMNTKIAGKLLENGDNLKTAIEIEAGLVEAKIYFQINFWKDLLEELGEGYSFGNEYKKWEKPVEESCANYYKNSRNNYLHGIIYDLPKKSRLMLIVSNGVYFCIKNHAEDVGKLKNTQTISIDSNGWFHPKIAKDKLNFKKFDNVLIDMLSNEKRKETIKALATEFKELVEKIRK